MLFASASCHRNYQLSGDPDLEGQSQMDGLGCHTVGENTVGKSKEHIKPASHRAMLILHSISAVRDGWHLPVLGPVRDESLRACATCPARTPTGRPPALSPQNAFCLLVIETQPYPLSSRQQGLILTGTSEVALQKCDI